VEKWFKTEGGKNYLKKVTVRVLGEWLDPPPAGWPDWVTEAISKAEIKHRDNWYRYPADMLAARAAKRVAKRIAPEAVLGLPGWDVDDGVRIGVHPDDVDVDPETGEIKAKTDDPARPITHVERTELIGRLDALSVEEQHQVSTAMMYGPAERRRSMIPKLRDFTTTFLVEHAEVLDAELAKYEEAEIVTDDPAPSPAASESQSRPAADQPGDGPATQGGAPPASDPSPDQSAGGRVPEPPDAPSADPPATDQSRDKLIAEIGALTPEQRAHLEKRCKEAGVPNLKQGASHKQPVLASHLLIARDLIEEATFMFPATSGGDEPFDE
jgi:hypothetical protein